MEKYMTYTLYTEATPNPLKVHIMLEELGLPYESVHVDFGKEEQKTSEFLKLNPNGRIPVLIDHEKEDFAIIESGAILLYLAEKHGKFLPDDWKHRSETIQWLMWQMAGLGPMFGQLFVFAAAFENGLPQATARYDSEVRRLFGVLNDRLAGRDFIAGEYSVADIACMGWIPLSERLGWDISDWPNLSAWFNGCAQRPAFKSAVASAGDIPEDVRMKNFRQATIGVGS
jgi:GST-like protein